MDHSQRDMTRRSFLAMGTLASAGVLGGISALAAYADDSPSGSSSASGPTSASGSTSSSAKVLPEGTYEETATGFNGPIVADASIGDDGIESIDVVSSFETPAIGAWAIDIMKDRILKYQSVNVDTVAGATAASLAMISIVSSAIADAGKDLADFSAETTIEYDGPAAEDVSTGVVVVGSGCAGMSVAIRIAREGVPVIVVEKRETLGGTSCRAGYQLQGVGSRTQKESTDVAYKTPDEFYDTYMAYDASGVTDPDMQRMRADGIGKIMDWVEFDMGVPMTRVEPGGMATMIAADQLALGRTWGGVLVEKLAAEMDRLGIDYRVQTRATAIITDGDKATGITVEAPNGTYNITADAVVIATGSFSSNPDMVAEYLPDWVGYVSTEVPTATGDGIIMGQDAGAALAGMDEDHLVVYSCCVKLGESQALPVAIRAAGGIVVNLAGKRFHDELDMQLINLAVAAKEQTDGRYFGIVDQKWVDGHGMVRTAVSEDTLEALATDLGIDPDGFVAEVAHYNEMYDAGTDTDFNRLSMSNDIRTPPYYGCELFTGLHGFDGGLLVDHRLQVLKEDGSTFGGLYAGGGGTEFGLATVSAMSGKLFTAKILADSLLEDLGYNS